MKPKFRHLRSLAIASSVMLCISYAHGQSLYWDSNSTTSGAGVTPTGTWGVDSFWNTDATGGAGTFSTATTIRNDVFFSAGTDAVNPYTVGLNSATQLARVVTFEDGTVTLNSGTLSLGNQGGITVTTGTGATISSNLTLSGVQSFNVAAGRTLTLDTGTFTRNAGATLNVLSTGTVTTTMTNLSSGSLVNGIIGPWASFGSGASTRYATIDGSNNIVGYTGGTAAATAANVTSTLGTVNYDVAAVGTLGAGANVNTLRYTGAAGTIAGALTTKGIMNVSGNRLTFSGAVTGSGELVVNTANGDISFSAANAAGSYGLVKTGSGRLTTSNADTTYSGNVTVNGGVLQYGDTLARLTTGNITLNGGVIEQRWTATNTLAQGSGAGQIQILGGESGFSENGATGLTWNIGAVTWGSATFNPSKFVLQTSASQSGSAVTFLSAINLNSAERTVVANAGAAGNATSTLGGALTGTGASGLIKEGAGILILNVANSYSGNTTISAGTLRIAATDRLGSASNTLIFNGGTLQASGAVTSPSTRAVTMTQTGIIDNNGQAISIAGNIGGAGGLTKNGAGTLTLSGTNGFGGVTTVNAGTLAITKQLSLYNNTPANWTAANLNVKSGATLQLNVDSAGTAGFTASNLDTLLGNISVANTAAQGLQAGVTLAIDTSTATGSTFTPSGAIANSTGAFGGVINLIKLGAGTLVLDQMNTYTGTTTISGGTIRYNDGGAISTAPLFLNGGSFALNSAGTVTQGTNFPGIIFGTGELSNVGAGTLVLNAPTLHTGNTSATAGNITLSHQRAVQFSALNTTGAGTVTLSGAGATTPIFGGLANSGTTRNLASVIDSSYSSVTNLTLNPQSGSSFSYGGVIADGATGMDLTKTGAGTQTLTGTNTYTGDTFLNGGTLALSGAAGALSATSGLTLNGGAITITNAAGQSAVDRVNNSAGITANGGTITWTNPSGDNTANWAETLGVLSLTTGQTNIVSTNAVNAARSQILTLGAGSLTHAAANTSVITFSGTSLGTTADDNNILITSEAATAANQIIGPWATYGTSAASQTDYAAYNITGGGANTRGIQGAGIAGSAETTWTTPANAYTTSAGGTVTLTGTRTITALRNTGASTVLTLATGNNLQTYGVLNGVATLFTIAPGTGGVLTTPTGGGNLHVNVNAGAGAITVSAPINNNGGNVTLVKNGSGTLTVSSTTSTYSGGTVINAGTLSYTADTALGAGGSRNITFGGSGSLTWGFDGSSLGTLTVNAGAEGTLTSLNNITFATTTGSGTIRAVGGQGKLANLGNASAFTGNVALAYNANNNSGANAPHISFSSLNDAVGSSIQFYRQGGGTDSGQIGQIGLAGNTGSLTFDNRQIQLLARTGGTGQSMATNYLLNNNATAANKWVINTNLLNLYDRDSTLGLGGTNTGDNAFNGLIGNSTAATFNSGTGVLSLAKTEAGTWTLGNTANTYTGATTVSAGILEVKSLANGGLASSIGASSNAAGNLLLANGTRLRYIGDGDTTDRNFTINVVTAGHGAILEASGMGALVFTNTATPGYGTTAQTRTLTLTGSNTDANTLAATLTNNGGQAVSITKQSLGRWVLSGANSYTGTTTISAGVLQAIQGTGIATNSGISLDGGVFQSSGTFTRSVGAVGTGSTAYNMTANGGGFSAIGGKFTVTLDNTASVRNWGITVSTSPLVGTLKFGSTSSNAEVEMTNNINLNGTNRTIEVTAGVGGDFATMSGVLSNSTGTAGLTKSGTGKLILANANTYNGATSVNAGTLLVNGSTNATSTVAVSAGATLGGTGTISGAVNVSGVLSPGASIESLATGALTMASGSTFVYEVANDTATGADMLGVNGALSLTNVNLSLDLATIAALSLPDTTWTVGDKLTLISYTGTGITSGFAGYTDDNTYNFGDNVWRFNYNDTVAGGNYGADAIIAGQTNFVTLTALTVIPEPSSVALLGTLGAMMLLRRRR